MSPVPQELTYCPTCRREFDGERALCPSDGALLRPVPRHALEPGCVLDDRLLVRDKLGAGGMGTIYLAKDLESGRDLALKVLKPQLGRDRAAVGQFYHEARAAGRLSHPYVVRIDSFGRSSDGFLYIAMELLDGLPLSSFLSRREPLPPAFALEVARQVCDALEAAHDKGTIHRDLKPENIFLLRDAPSEVHIKVLDFGIASVLAYDADRSGPMEEEKVSGTPAYMSPEQVMGRPVDPRADLYSLGVLLFEMLTGHTPFDADDPLDICRQHLNEPAPDIDGVLPPGSLPAPLAKLLRQLLLKQPSRRPRDARLVRARLEEAQNLLAETPLVPWDGSSIDGPAEPDPAEALRIPEPIPTPRPPLVRHPDGGLRVMPYRGGDPAQLDVPPLLPRENEPTLVNAFQPLAPVAEAMTLRTALWVCPACARLNATPDGPCENCGERLSGPLSGVPALSREDVADAESGAWQALLEDDAPEPLPEARGLFRTPQDTAPSLERVAAPVDGRASLDAARTKRTEVALLHVQFSGDGPDGEALPLDEVRDSLEEALGSWRVRLRSQGGFICQDAGNVLRVLFGALPGPRHHRWLEHAADAALSLREAVSRSERALDGTVYLRGALCVGSVFLDPDLLADADHALRGSPVDLSTRLARTAPAGEIVLNGALWRRVASAYTGRPCNTVRARGAHHPELVYRLDARRRRRITHRKLEISNEGATPVVHV